MKPARRVGPRHRPSAGRVGGRGGSSCPPHHPSTPLEGVGPFRRKSRKTLLPQPPWLGLGESGESTVHRLTPPHLWRVWVHSGGRVERHSSQSHYVRAAAPLSGASPVLRQAEHGTARRENRPSPLYLHTRVWDQLGGCTECTPPLPLRE